MSDRSYLTHSLEIWFYSQVADVQEKVMEEMEEIKMKRNSYEGVKNKRNGSEMVRVKKINGKNKWEASSMAV